LISVCLLTRGPSRHLDACLDSLATQNDGVSFEVLVCSNGGPEIVDAVRHVLPAADVCHVERSPLCAARNVLIERARGEWLLFLDDDVTVPADTMHRLVTIATAHSEATVARRAQRHASRQLVLPARPGRRPRVVRGLGPVRRRYGPHPAGSADERFFTLCNLAVQRSAMVPFPTEISGGEENAVLGWHEEGRDDDALRPTFVAFHERRPEPTRATPIRCSSTATAAGNLTRRSPSSFRARTPCPPVSSRHC